LIDSLYIYYNFISYEAINIPLNKQFKYFINQYVALLIMRETMGVGVISPQKRGYLVQRAICSAMKSRSERSNHTMSDNCGL
jgi:hypothetical protein